MTSIEWGPAIAKGSYAWPADQRQPEWVMNEDSKEVQAKNGRGSWLSVAGNASLSAWSWGHIPAIRLPADHWAYRAIEKGFVPWAGGDAAPADWDGGAYLMANGNLSSGGCDWSRNPVFEERGCYVIGYRRKDALREPDDTGKYKLVERRTRDEWQRYFAENDFPPSIGLVTKLGLIREPTKAERVAEKTGMDVATVQRVLDALDD